MGQEEVYNLLKANPNRWFTLKEIKAHLNIGKNSLSANLRRMRYSAGKFIKVNSKEIPFKYKINC